MKNYEMFQKVISYEDYLKTWKIEDLKLAREKDKLNGYAKYKFRAEVLIRDNHTCQHMGEDGYCPYCKNVKYYINLTAHHIKHQRNIKNKYEGDFLRKKLYDKRNGATICDMSHQAFNSYKIGLCFTGEQLHPRVKGHTFWLHKPLKIYMKEASIKGKILRKQYKGVSILRMHDMHLLAMWFRFLTIPYYELWKKHQIAIGGE